MIEAPRASRSDVWHAVADPTRRRIMDMLRVKAQTTGELCAQFTLSRFATMKHLAVLEKAGLLVVRRRGRERWNHLHTEPLRAIVLPWLQSCIQSPPRRWRSPQPSAFRVEED